jgi:MoxR-like ATPase
LPDDIRLLATQVLAHRILLRPEAELNGLHAHEVVSKAIETVPYGSS